MSMIQMLLGAAGAFSWEDATSTSTGNGFTSGNPVGNMWDDNVSTYALTSDAAHITVTFNPPLTASQEVRAWAYGSPGPGVGTGSTSMFAYYGDPSNYDTLYATMGAIGMFTPEVDYRLLSKPDLFQLNIRRNMYWINGVGTAQASNCYKIQILDS